MFIKLILFLIGVYFIILAAVVAANMVGQGNIYIGTWPHDVRDGMPGMALTILVFLGVLYALGQSDDKKGKGD